MADDITIIRPALLAHVFFAADQFREPGSPARACLESLWDACAALGIDQPVHGLPDVLDVTIGAQAEHLLLTGQVQVLAGREKPDPGSVMAAVVYRYHDVVGIMIMMAPNAVLTTWADLDARWTAATTATATAAAAATTRFDAALGSVLVHIGLLRGAEATSTDGHRLATLLRAAVPAPAHGDWTVCWNGSPNAATMLWELPWRDSVPIPAHRRLLVVAPEERETDLDRWLWSRDTPGLVPLTRYLIYATKIRYECGVLARDLPRLRELGRRVDAGATDLLGRIETFRGRGWQGRPEPNTPTLRDLREAGQRLRELRAGATGLVHSTGLLLRLTETLRIAVTNATAAFDGDFDHGRSGPLDVDRQLAETLAAQLAAETTMLTAARDRSAEAVQSADTVIDGYLRDRQAELTVLQTAVIGGLLMVLGAIQTLNYTLPLPGVLEAPLIALLGSLALALPIVVPYWRLLDADLTSRRRTIPVVALALVGATTGWFSTTLVAAVLLDHPLPSAPTLLFAGIGAVLAAAVGRRRFRNLAR